MSDEGNKRRRRRLPRRRPRTGDAATPRNEGDSAQRSRPAGKSRQRGRKRSGASGRRPRRDRGQSNWWAQRWSTSLDVIQVGRRLGHGRTYARQGRVIELEFEKGSATAMVQGSRDAPYLVRMHFSTLSATDWKRVLHALGEDTDLGGGLFRGEFPKGVEEAFTSLSLSLFPSGQGDLKAACSCPDQANPCKHVAAVFYRLGEEVDRDPFLLLRLRGLDRTELMEALARTPAARAALVAPPSADAMTRAGDNELRPQDRGRTSAPLDEERRQPAEEPLPAEPQVFWAGLAGERDGEAREEVRLPMVSGALARRLGGFPFWRGENSCNVVMDQIYQASSQVGLSIYLGEPDPEKTEER